MRHVTFLHWPLPADVVAARLPSGLVADLREGQAWVSYTITYTARRRSPHRPHGHRFVVRPRAPLQPHELSERDHFLTGRWRAHTTVAGVLAVVPVEHESWPLREAEVLDLEEDLFAAVGLPAPGRAPVVGYSPGVDARLGPVRTVRHLKRLSDG